MIYVKVLLRNFPGPDFRLRRQRRLLFTVDGDQRVADFSEPFPLLKFILFGLQFSIGYLQKPV